MNTDHVIASLREQLATAQAVIRDYEDTRREDRDFTKGCAGLTQSENVVLAMIVRHKRISTARIYHALYADNIDGGPDPKVISVYAHRIRNQLAPHGVTIATVWGFGFEITTDDAAKVSQLIAAHVEAQ